MNKFKSITNWIGERSSLIASTCLVTFITAIVYLFVSTTLENGEMLKKNTQLQIEKIELKSELQKSFLYLNQSQDVIGRQRSIMKSQEDVIKNLIKKLEALQYDGRFSARFIAAN